MSSAAATAASMDALVETWRKRIQQARDYRRQFEPIWVSNLAFAAGQHWLVWHDGSRQLVERRTVDPRYADRDLYTEDRITEYRSAALGEMGSDDDRPELLTAQEGEQAESVADQLNQALQHAWDHECQADNALEQARAFAFDLGLAAIRCRRDPNYGQVVQGNTPVYQGRPVVDLNEARQLMQGGPRQDVQMKRVREGRTVWEPLSALNLLMPPGVTHEDGLPWFVIVRPCLIADVQAEFGDRAAGLREDGDIGSVIGLTTSQANGRDQQSDTRGRLHDSVWLFTAYEMPNAKNPDGQIVNLASNDMRLLREPRPFEYRKPNGDPSSGVHFFHWWRLNDRIYSRAGIENLKDGQRVVNEIATGSLEIMRRGYPKIVTEEGAVVETPSGAPMENIELKPGTAPPTVMPGVGPGPWMFQLKEAAIEALSHASTISPLRLGENPNNVDTYSQLALLNDNEAIKRSLIRRQHNQAIAGLVEDTVWDIRTYWPDGKQMLLNVDDQITRASYEKARIPDFFLVKTARGGTQPRTQGAELKRIDAIWAAVVAALGPSMATNGELAERWVRWYNDSLEAGKPLDLPETLPDSQIALARFENELMRMGEEAAPADYDLFPAHLPEHRAAQDQARAAGDAEWYARIDRHIQASIQMQQANAQKVADAQQTPAPPGLHPQPAPPVSGPPAPLQLPPVQAAPPVPAGPPAPGS